ncbi:MAG: 2-hydroxychromene-2-carboxylate isomerase [Proteobacteria bacterium]|nr:2-hydroxychromene-2-carboxylate isomerase [Pseudomonadota bacterium]
MSASVTFYFSLLSPWVYFGGPRFQKIVAGTGATAIYKPIDVLRVFRETAGAPLGQLHPSRQAYRARERERWAQLLDMPVSAKPRFHPADESLAARMVIALDAQDHAAAWPLAQAILAAVWVRDLDIADPATLAQLASEQGMDGKALLAKAQEPATLQTFTANTDEALAAGVFGVPSFVVGSELFFGQDRLDFVERALRA